MAAKFTLDDKIVTDSLEAISQQNGKDQHKLIVVGGVATQLYIAEALPDLLRPTHDADLCSSVKLNADSFRHGIGSELAARLPHYQPDVDVGRHVYSIMLASPENIPFFIHLYRWTEKGFEREKKNLERQVSDANSLPIPGSERTVKVVRPEDIILGKLRRLKLVNETGNIPAEQAEAYRLVKNREWAMLAAQDLSPWRDSLMVQKEALTAFYDAGQDFFRKAHDSYVSSKDLFDISLLARLLSGKKLEFNDRYYDSICASNRLGFA